MSERDRWESWVADTLRARNLHEPEKDVLDRALALGESLAPRRKSAVGWLVEALFDSAMGEAAAGVRRAGAGERRLLYRCIPEGDTSEAGHQLDLRLRQRPTGDLEVTGQLLPPWPGAKVEIRVGRTRRSQSMGVAGEFLLRDIPNGNTTFDLKVSADDATPIVLEEIRLDAGEDE